MRRVCFFNANTYLARGVKFIVVVETQGFSETIAGELVVESPFKTWQGKRERWIDR